MGKKQSRQNRGGRTGGHERSAASEPREKTRPTTNQDTVRSISEQVSHRKQRRFGHN
ncbi:hypothetical protein [Streptomyces sp. PTD5-9]|uniref:hypothetical protein n=1 Tax=Streptomyces sp. PTD5-9 TaxID=3120150 RepID=UPI00300AE635